MAEVNCACHDNPYAPCDIPGGCGPAGCDHTQEDSGLCLSGTGCKAHDGRTAHPTPNPLCYACLEHAEPDIRGLVYDYLDLAQLHEASLSQAITERTSGSPESPMLLAGNIEALQAEIVHVTATWEHALRAVDRLSNPRTFTPLWRTTVYDHIYLTRHDTSLHKARPGAVVQRAVTVIAPRLARLAALPAITVCPTGIEDEPRPVYGWEAVHHLTDLHSLCRSLLGRTRRTLALYGTCPSDTCPAEALHRYEPQDAGDEPPVWCDVCKTSRPYPDYEWFMTHLAWPQATDFEQLAA